MLSPHQPSSNTTAAFAAECARLSAAVAALTPEQWARPSRCEPWDAAALLAHITGAVGRLPRMLDAEPPAAATVTAAGYYRPDVRFSPEATTNRIDEAAANAAAGGPAVADAFTATWKTIADRCRAEAPGRLVTTRHGDPMTLDDFMTTRVVEVAVHGIDLADAVGEPRWTTPEAARCIVALLLETPDALATLGWDPVAFIATATGRDTMTDAERNRAETLGVTWLTLA
ncbi:maleylpyruvate isomerase family mycothiol-dependent enzyme [Glycomyces arizonensis]|uniref:maleylpyruvate isomerase family mycothiol-dependent enzyme n=1 Tax=Glycomyces arizonensis TaxID=256035 RepID=UPI0003F775DA|nr:maleylpyruvate isomerase family mycothiol-dependent enzyme [Glycomyces arizonensis]